MTFMIQRPDTAFSLDKTGKTQKRIESPAHLAFIRRLPSVISGVYGVEAAHIRYGDPIHRKPKTAKGRKPDDCYVLPLTPTEHASQHRENEKLWWDEKGLDPIRIALNLYDVSGDVPAGVEIIQKVLSASRGFQKRKQT